MQLSVPYSLAGVAGPCPQCQAQISAPRPAPQAPGMPQQQHAADQRPSSVAKASVLGESIRPEPRQHPSRVSAVQSPRVEIHSDQRARVPVCSPQVMAISRKPHRSKRILRFLVPILILGAVGLMFFYLSQFLKSHGVESSKKNAQQQATPHAATTIESELGVDTIRGSVDTPIAVEDPAKVAVKTTAPEQPIVEVTVPQITAPEMPAVDPIPAAAGAKVPAVKNAITVLEEFLNASSLDVRKPMMVTKSSDGDLIAAKFDKTWPPYTITIGSQNTYPKERLVEYYYLVNFEENQLGFPKLAIFLLQKRGDEEAKVVVAPLLDTIGGRLATFAAQPQPQPQDFYAVMEAVMFCRNDKIPNAKKKSEFYLRASNKGENIAVAYVNEQSEIHKAFTNPDPLDNLKWKNPIPVVVTLHWNSEEDPARPFLEIIEIKAKNWNP